VATLAAKAPDDVPAYKQLVLGVAETVADAKGGVKPGETAAIATIEEALA
jgi:tellurite resistance protein